jgi:hypothetical protein
MVGLEDIIKGAIAEINEINSFRFAMVVMPTVLYALTCELWDKALKIQTY